MKTHFSLKVNHPARIVLSLLVLFVIAACSSQAPTGSGVVQTTTPQTTNPAIPNTGLATSTPVLAPTATAPAPTQAATTQAAATQIVSTQAAQVQAQTAPAAPQCISPAASSSALTEGPYFKANSPERTSLLRARNDRDEADADRLCPDNGLQTGGERAGRFLAGERRGAVR